MKNYKKYNEGDVVLILHSHSGNEGKIGKILEVRHSFCKVQLEDSKKPVNCTYGQFKKLELNESTEE